MKIQPITKDTVEQPLLDPAGESVYELIGNTTRIQPVAHPNRVDEHPQGANHSLAQIRIAPGAASKPHYHKICQESYYILSGQAKMTIDDQELELTPGQACLILPGQIHQICNKGNQILEFLAVCVPAWYASDSVYIQEK